MDKLNFGRRGYLVGVGGGGGGSTEWIFQGRWGVNKLSACEGPSLFSPSKENPVSVKIHNLLEPGCKKIYIPD